MLAVGGLVGMHSVVTGYMDVKDTGYMDVKDSGSQSNNDEDRKNLS